MNCFGHGDCLNGMCTCDLGYTGDLCNEVTEACPQNCSGHGTCQGGKCFCRGQWSGAACNQEIFNCPFALHNCTGHGLCQPSGADSNAPWTCSCDEGFCGDACSLACPKCINNCTGHGACDGIVCICDVGYAGDDCSLVQGLCPKNCSGHGRCVIPGSGIVSTSNTSKYTPHCECTEGFYGESCDSLLSDWQSRCPRNCSGKGLCGTNGCKCQPGFVGKSCETAHGMCEFMNRCSGNGQCANGTCQCYPGYSGFDCTISCRQHYDGDAGCHSDIHRGLCVNGTCVCKPEWTGQWCEVDNEAAFLKGYYSGWKPLGFAVLGVSCTAAVSVVAFLLYNKFAKKKKGINAVPGYSDIRTRVKGEEYPE